MNVLPANTVNHLLLLFVGLCLTGISITAHAQKLPSDSFKKALRELVLTDTPSSFKDRFEAEVWLLDMATRVKKLYPGTRESETLEILKTVHMEAKRLELSPQLILAIIHVESGFEKFAISHAGARGLMQIMPFWMKEIGTSEDNLFKIPTNIRYGCSIFKLYLQQTKGDIMRALARYNGSRGSTKYSKKVLNKLQKYWRL